MTSSARIFLVALAIVAGRSAAQAQTLVGGSDLITTTEVGQFGTWLGEGPLTLTRIYSKSNGHTSSDFHAAADNVGRTFVVIEASVGGGTVLIGGYNPMNWKSAPVGWSLTPNAVDRTGFIFNLNTTSKFAQRTDTAAGQYLAYNDPTYGPTFGESDIYLAADMTFGLATEASYGAAPTNVFGNAGTTVFQAGHVEVFTVSPVPEPASLFVLGAGAIVLVRRRRAR
jgi:hypothetical protein